MSEEDGAIFDLSQLRNLVRQYIDQHMYKTALFWADKVYTLSKKEPQDCLWLAHAFFLTKQFSRAVHLLKTNGLILKNSTAKYLAARCLYEEKDFKTALETLESETNDKLDYKNLNGGTCNSSVERNSSSSGNSSVFANHGNNRKLESSIALLKGMIHESFENKVLAIKCYKDALQHDVYCFEAFNCLVSHNIMNTSEECLFLQTLPFSQQCSAEEEKLLKVVYGCKINKFSLRVNEQLPLHLELLKDNLDYIVCNAEKYFNNYHYKEAFQLATFVYKADPFHESCLPLYISCLVEFKMKNELYHIANKLVNSYPSKAVSWFAVGSYYLLVKKNEPARKYFSKATTLDMNFGPAWLGFAHSYASEGERDQAISAYFSASKLMPGSHLPYLYLGLEYSLSNNFLFASKFYKEALAISPDDLHIRIELGVLGYENGEYKQAEAYLLTSLEKIEKIDCNASDIVEPLFINLGHVSRKLKKFDEGIMFYQKSLLLNPKCSSTYASIGLCYLLKRNFKSAVENCHKSLALKKHDTVTLQLLEQALDCLSHSKDHLLLDEKVIFSDKSESRLSSSSIDLSCVSNNATPLIEMLESSTIEMSDSLCMSLDLSNVNISI